MDTRWQEAIRPSMAEHTQRINRAVTEGLNQCYSSQNSLDSEEFSDRDIGNIRAAVFRYYATDCLSPDEVTE